MFKAKKRKGRTDSKKTLIEVIIISVVICGILGTLLYKFKTDNDVLSAQYEQAQTELNSLTRDVYVAAADIKANEILTTGEEDEDGNILTEANVTMQTIKSDLTDDAYITPEELGSRVLVDISMGEPVLKSMVSPFEYEKTDRYYELSLIDIMESLEEGDVIDVRISYPDGEEKKVVTKKQIDLLPESHSYLKFRLNEPEILNMGSALVDCILIPGTRMYTTEYVNNAQEKASETYIPRYETLALLLDGEDPDITDGLSLSEKNILAYARNTLENYLNSLPKEQTDAIASVFGSSGMKEVEGDALGTAGSSSGLRLYYDEETGSWNYMDESGNIISDEEAEKTMDEAQKQSDEANE